jgi:general secretion pathway protein G
MVVMIIIAVLASLIMPRLMGRLDEAKVTEAKIQIKNFETALRLFKADNDFYPSTEQGLEALISPPATGQLPEHYRAEGYLEKKVLPKDPWGHEYIYISPGTKGDYDIITYGADYNPAEKDTMRISQLGHVKKLGSRIRIASKSHPHRTCHRYLHYRSYYCINNAVFLGFGREGLEVRGKAHKQHSEICV